MDAKLSGLAAGLFAANSPSPQKTALSRRDHLEPARTTRKFKDFLEREVEREHPSSLRRASQSEERHSTGSNFDRSHDFRKQDLPREEREQPRPAEPLPSSTSRGLRAWGRLVKDELASGEEEAPALSFIQGKSKQLQPQTIPTLVAENTFISQALAQDLSKFMSQKFSVAELAEMLGLKQDVVAAGLTFGLDPNEKVTPSQFLKCLGIDPGQVSAELHRLKWKLSDSGLSSYMTQDELASSSLAGEGSQEAVGEKLSEETKNPKTEGEGEDSLLSRIAALGALTISAQIPLQAELMRAKSGKNESSLLDSVEALGEEGKNKGLMASLNEDTPEDPFSLAAFQQSRGAMAQNGDEARNGFLNDLTATNNPNSLSEVPSLEKDLLNGQETGTPSPLNEAEAGGSLAKEELTAKDASEKSAYAPNFDLSSLANKTKASQVDGARLADYQNALAKQEAAAKEMKAQLQAEQMGVEEKENLATAPLHSLNGDKLKSQAGIQPTTAQAAELAKIRSLDLLEGHRNVLVEQNAGSNDGNAFGDSSKRDSMLEHGRSQLEAFSPLGMVGGGDRATQAFQSILQTSNSGTSSSLMNVHPSVKSELIEKIMDRSQVMIGQGGGTALVRVQDKDLGELSLAVQVSGDEVRLKMLSPSEQIRNLFGSDLNQLRETLSAQNLQLVDVDIGHDRGDGQQAFQQFDFAQQRQAFSQNENGKAFSLTDKSMQNEELVARRPLSEVRQSVSTSNQHIQVMV